jgi:hypothetical protein
MGVFEVIFQVSNFSGLRLHHCLCHQSDFVIRSVHCCVPCHVYTTFVVGDHQTSEEFVGYCAT